MAYVNVPNDLSKIKTKMAFNLTKRQLICFGIAAAVGIPTYLLTRSVIGNTGAMLLMIGLMLPCFLLAMMTEAKKYLGYPYVWGGYCPSTSFDCSGFVSWVINHSGWNVGRLGAQGLYNICTPVSSANARPGDLVFFIGTYDTTGVTHANTYGVYPSEIAALQKDYAELWGRVSDVLKQLAEVVAL